jgi:hypothetical protein
MTGVPVFTALSASTRRLASAGARPARLEGRLAGECHGDQSSDRVRGFHGDGG